MSGSGPWWDGGVIYQVYVRSFADSNGDGVGDLPGLISRLEHLEWLGVDAVWCSPITPSANRDWGYDVTDYKGVEPTYGTLADVDRLVEEAGRRNIKVLLDIVPNHTSDQHPWFHDPERRDWYVWTDRPNNWVGMFRSPAWQYVPEVGGYYLHNFAVEQPDLNWWNEDVRKEFDDILRFWFDRGVAGFRIDVAHALIKDRELRDNPADDEHFFYRRLGQLPVYNMNRPEVHDIWRRWRHVAERYDPARLLMGETHVFDIADWASYYGRNDELQLALNFVFMFAPFQLDALRDVVEESLRAMPEGAVPVWGASNHDLSRFPTRWCRGSEALVRLVLTMLFTLPGATLLYQGDEIGMEDVEVPPERVLDVARPSRDPQRTPMPWTAAAGGGFTTGEPWLPMGDPAARNVAAQCDDPGSLLYFTRELVALKKRLDGPYEALPSEPGVWRYRRGEVSVELDFERAQARVDG